MTKQPPLIVPTLKVAMIYGSTREGRLCDHVAEWAYQQLNSQPHIAIDVIDPLQLQLPDIFPRREHPAVTQLQQRLAEADAFIVITPEYNHGYPAALKHLIDLVSSEWEAKPVGFVSYGGMSGGIRAIEQLRQVFAELHAVTLRDAVCFIDVWSQFSAVGTLYQPATAERAMTTMLQRLRWWAHALKTAREQQPYGELV